MIRLPSFFKRKSQAEDPEMESFGKRSARRTAPRSFQRATEAEELALTEDPEQQRARHRLIGAAVLVLIAVIGLPRVLDNKPKPAPNDIAINIVTSLPIPGADTKSEEKSKSDTVSESAKEAPKAVPKEAVKEHIKDSNQDSSKSPSEQEVKPESKAEAKTTAPTNKAPVLGLAAGEEVVAAPTKPKADDAKSASNGVGPGSGKYVIQIGAFASEDRAKGWISKLKAEKIPNYVVNKNGADGVKLFVLRAGPFADKEAAESAEKRIKAMGLSPRLVETGKQ